VEEKIPCVYILASRWGGALYVGVTSNLYRRLFEHRQNFVPGFSQRYGVYRLVWYEVHSTMESAIRREKAIKKWNRAWKVRLIEKENPEWRDRSADL
jgi:putative endonuclease